MKLKSVVSLLVAFMFMGASGCATIMKQEYEELFIRSQPAGAFVELTGGLSCHTPCSLELERGSDYSLTIKKPGYKTKQMDVNGSSWDAWLLGNIVFIVFPVAVAYDFYSGYAYDFSPDEIEVDLQKK